MANAVAALHKSGVVHGDLKPRNVVRVGRVLLLIDLDMAFSSNQFCARSDGVLPDARRHSSLAGTGISVAKVSGSSAYAYPELLGAATVPGPGQQPGSSTVDYASAVCGKLTSPEQVDVWAFGATLYAMVAGAPLLHNRYESRDCRSLSGLL